jgi:hypothetical protein
MFAESQTLRDAAENEEFQGDKDGDQAKLIRKALN